MTDHVADQKIRKFDGTNFPLFKFKIRLLLEDREVWEFVEAETERPTEANAARAYDKKIRKAMATICLNLEDSQLRMVQNTTTPKQAFDTLCAHYEKKTFANKLYLRRKFFTVLKQPGVSMLDHINVVKDLANQLQAINDPVMEDDIVTTLLSSLPDEYDGLITALESQKPQDLSLEFVTVHLLHEETKHTEKQGAYEMALTSKNENPNKPKSKHPKQKGKQNKKVTCSVCHREGHTDDTCWMLEKYKDKRPEWLKTLMQPHAKVVCDENSRQENSSDSEEENALLAMDARSKWFIDSGASKHIYVHF